MKNIIACCKNNFTDISDFEKYFGTLESCLDIFIQFTYPIIRV